MNKTATAAAKDPTWITQQHTHLPACSSVVTDGRWHVQYHTAVHSAWEPTCTMHQTQKHPYEPAWQTVHKHMCWQQHMPHNTMCFESCSRPVFHWPTVWRRRAGAGCVHIQIEEGQRTGKVHRPQEPGNPASPRRRPVSAAPLTANTPHSHATKGWWWGPSHIAGAGTGGGKTAAGSDCMRLPVHARQAVPPTATTTTPSHQEVPTTLCAVATPSRSVGTTPICATTQLTRELQRYPARTSTLAHSLSSRKQPRPASGSTNKRFCSQTSHQSMRGCVNACGISSCSHRVHMCQDRDGEEAVLGRGGRPAAPSPAHQACGHGQGLGLGGCRHCGARETSGGVLCRQAPAAAVAGRTGDVCGGSRHLAALVRAALLSCCCCGCCCG